LEPELLLDPDPEPLPEPEPELLEPELLLLDPDPEPLLDPEPLELSRFSVSDPVASMVTASFAPSAHESPPAHGSM
jgi:hypothetical protein